MKNKLGIIDDEILTKVEYKISNYKHKLIDEFYTFNEDTIFSLDYLEKLHIFLFSDIYGVEDCKIRDTIVDNAKSKIQEILNKMKLLTYDMDKEELADCIYDIWEEQIFLDGNTRTLRAFLKVYCLGYDITIDHDFDEDIYDDYFIDKFTSEIAGNTKKYNLK